MVRRALRIVKPKRFARVRTFAFERHGGPVRRVVLRFGNAGGGARNRFSRRRPGGLGAPAAGGVSAPIARTGGGTGGPALNTGEQSRAAPAGWVGIGQTGGNDLFRFNLGNFVCRIMGPLRTGGSRRPSIRVENWICRVALVGLGLLDPRL